MKPVVQSGRGIRCKNHIKLQHIRNYESIDFKLVKKNGYEQNLFLLMMLMVWSFSDVLWGVFTCEFSYFLQSAILQPVHVVDPLEEAGGPLVAPERRRHTRPEVRKGAVAQLKELVPLHGVVDPGLQAAEADSIVHDVLGTETRRSAAFLWIESRSCTSASNTLLYLITSNTALSTIHFILQRSSLDCVFNWCHQKIIHKNGSWTRKLTITLTFNFIMFVYLETQSLPMTLMWNFKKIINRQPVFVHTKKLMHLQVSPVNLHTWIPTLASVAGKLRWHHCLSCRECVHLGLRLDRMDTELHSKSPQWADDQSACRDRPVDFFKNF